jgi:hypothetical protein
MSETDWADEEAGNITSIPWYKKIIVGHLRSAYERGVKDERKVWVESVDEVMAGKRCICSLKQDSEAALAAAERQGVIKGMREAADDMLKTNDDECVQWAVWLRLRADELEKQKP